MDFSKKGWLKQYLRLRNNYTLKKEYDRLMEMENIHEPETILYDLLQPTGFLYGHAANIPINYKSFLRALRTEKMPIQHKTKIILTESFLHSGIISPRYQQISQHLDVADALLESAIFIGKFYAAVYPNLNATHTSGFFRRDKKGMDLSEHMIGIRTESNANEHNFWEQYFKSSLLFLDVLYFGKWLNAFKDENEAEQLIESHQKDRFLIFKTILAAAYANKKIEREEKQLIQNYLDIAQFDEQTQEETLKLIDNGLTLNYIDFSSAKSQAMKKHLLELAILTVCADRIINADELKFLERLYKLLNLDKRTFQSSMIAVESFIVEYWQQIQMKSEDKIKELGTHLLERIAMMLKAQEKALKLALQNNPQLLTLLQKNQKEKISTEDRNKIRKGLFEVMTTLPYFSSIALPKTYLTFPNIMQVFPENILEEIDG